MTGQSTLKTLDVTRDSRQAKKHCEWCLVYDSLLNWSFVHKNSNHESGRVPLFKVFSNWAHICTYRK